MPDHARRTARHAAPRPGVVRRAWTWTAVLVVAVTAGLLGTGGSYALWSSSATPLGAVRLTSGTASLSATPTGDLSPLGLLPGTSAVATVALRNGGDVPLAVSVSVAGAAGAFDGPRAGASLEELALRVAPVPADGVCRAGLTTGRAGPLVGFVASEVVPALAQGGTTAVCVELLLDADAPQEVQGGVASWTLQVDGRQVTT